MTLISVAYYGLWALNIYFILKNKENKTIAFLTWVLLYFLFASNSAVGGDAYKYKLDYESGAFGTNWAKVMAGSTVIVIPLLILFAFTQRWFISGLSGDSGVKE